MTAAVPDAQYGWGMVHPAAALNPLSIPNADVSDASRILR